MTPIKGRAAIADGRGDYTFADIDVSDPGPGEVLVRVMASGVCHTDYKMMRNRNAPWIMGHEGAGVVMAVGSGVAKVAQDDRVLLNWAMPCGACFQCVRGNQNICENPSRTPVERTRCGGEPIERMFGLGTMSTHTVVPQSAVVRLDVPVPFESACILGCGVMTGVGSVLNAARVEAGSSVAVLGAGGVGLNCIQGARIAGATTIIAIDVRESRLEMARRFGATHIIRATDGDATMADVVRQVRGLTGGRGADYAFESTSIPALGAAPLALVRNAGTAVQLSGIEQVIPFDAELFEWDKTYINPLYGKCRPDVDFPRLLGFYADRRLLLDELVTRTYPLEQLRQAFADMHAGINAKGVIVLGD